MDPAWGMLLWLVMVTGCRRGELCAVRWTDVQLVRGSLMVERAHPQAQREENEVEPTTPSITRLVHGRAFASIQGEMRRTVPLARHNVDSHRLRVLEQSRLLRANQTGHRDPAVPPTGPEKRPPQHAFPRAAPLLGNRAAQLGRRSPNRLRSTRSRHRCHNATVLRGLGKRSRQPSRGRYRERYAATSRWPALPAESIRGTGNQTARRHRRRHVPSRHTATADKGTRSRAQRLSRNCHRAVALLKAEGLVQASRGRRATVIEAS